MVSNKHVADAPQIDAGKHELPRDAVAAIYDIRNAIDENDGGGRGTITFWEGSTRRTKQDCAGAPSGPGALREEFGGQARRASLGGDQKSQNFAPCQVIDSHI
jgi:hypothetical protein